MNFESFGEELRKHREQKQMSLAAIAEATRINEKMLEAIEAGRFSVLPQAYIRAFIRAYAKALDLSPDELLRQYDALNREVQSAAEEWVNRPKAPTRQSEKRPPSLAAHSSRTTLPSILIAVLILALAAAVLYFLNKGATVPIPEPLSKVPFDKAVRESEAAVVQPETALVQTPSQPVPRPVADSLRLEITTTDSVWVSVLIDNVRKGEYLFPPRRTRSWAAKEQFVISTGNAGAASFRLDGADLGMLGKRGAVARNILITKSGIHQVQ